MSDAGDCIEPSAQPAPIDLTFDDAAPLMPCNRDIDGPLPAGAYAPTNDPTAPGSNCQEDTTNPDVFDSPAPTGPYPVGLAAFNGVNPNGAWSLYVMDQFNGDDGAVDGGWSLDLAIPAGTLAGAPQITGTPEAGKTLTAVSGALGNGAAAAYQWSRCTSSGRGCSQIAGATQGTYRPVRADRGHALLVTETAVTSGGGSAPLASAATKPVGPALLSTAGTKLVQHVLRSKGVIAAIRSNIAGTLKATGTISVPNGARTVRLKSAQKRLRPAKRTTVRLRLTNSGLGAVRAALTGGNKLKAKLTLVVTDPNGGKSTKKLTVRLK
jgi:hypothetical protein